VTTKPCGMVGEAWAMLGRCLGEAWAKLGRSGRTLGEAGQPKYPKPWAETDVTYMNEALTPNHSSKSLQRR
jgi:hypothetical protein